MTSKTGTSPGGDGSGFERLSESEVFRGHVFSVGVGRYADPTGAEFERAVIHHPGAVAVIAVNATGSAVLVRQFRAAMGTTVLEAPAGTRDVAGETAVDAAKRELAEEAGVVAGTWRELITIANSPGISDQRTTVFLATDLEPCGHGRTGAEEEHMTVEDLPLLTLEAAVSSGRLIDATTVVGMSLARSLLGSFGSDT